MPILEDISTIATAFIDVTDHFSGSSRAAFRRKVDGEWVDTTHAELFAMVEALALALRARGIAHGDRMGVMSENRLEWVVTDFACVCSGIVDVSTFPILTARQIGYVLNHAGVKAVVCSNRLQLKKLHEIIDDLPTLQHIIVMQQDAIDAYERRFDRTLLSWDQLLEEGRGLARSVPGQLRTLAAQSQPDDLLTLIYTSGTTGDPKGVMLTQGNFAANVRGALDRLPIRTEDVVLSYLPLCHAYERTAGYYSCFIAGATIAFADSIETVPANMLEVRPTLMTSVPRLFERIKTRIERQVKTYPPTRRALFAWAMRIGREHLAAERNGRIGIGLRSRYRMAESLVNSRLRERLGLSRLRFFVSGGGPLPRDVAEFFFAVGLVIVEGYGLTEASPIIAANLPERPRVGTVGPPLFNVEVRIESDGEILTRGPHVMKGYLDDAEATAAVIDAGGWLHTGDVGEFDAEGSLRITDRKKNLIVLSNGKNLAPQAIEGALRQNRLIDQMLLIGDGRAFLTALIVPDFEALREVAEAVRTPVGSMSDADERRALLDSDQVALAFDGAMRDAQRDLGSFERVRRYRLLDEPFTVDNGLLTPTLKVKRRAVEGQYRDLIEEMYEGADL